jgi:hypothetical protein
MQELRLFMNGDSQAKQAKSVPGERTESVKAQSREAE